MDSRLTEAYMKIRRYGILAFLAIFLFSGTALAHKVNVFAYAEAGKIYTESYFPDGKAIIGGKVQVYDSSDRLLLEGVTDDKGLFSFDIPKMDDLKIVIDAGMGHRNSFDLKRSDVETGK